MLDDVYNKRILSLAANIPLLQRLPSPDATARAHSKLCGSTVTVDVTMEGDVELGAVEPEQVRPLLGGSRHGEAEAERQSGTEQGFANGGLAKANGAHHVSGVEQGKRFW